MPLCRVMSSIYSARIAPTLGKPPCAAAHCGLCLIQPAPSVLGPLAGRGQQLVNAVRVQLRVQRAPAVSLGARGSELPLQLRLIRLLVSALAAPSRGGADGGGAAVGRVVGQEAARADNAPAPPQPLQARTRSGQGRCRGDYQITLRCMCRCSYARRL